MQAATTRATQPVVYVVDDDEHSLWLIRELLRGIGADCLTFSSALRFLDTYAPKPSECLICDLRMPEFGGLEVQKRLLAARASLPIIFVSGYAEVSAAVAAIKTGAFDFLEKPLNGTLLIGKVQEALVLSRTLHAERLERAAREARLALLTTKEHEVAKHVCAGSSSREIAARMHLSVRTIENHRASVMRKLRASSLAELIRLLP